MKKDLWIVIETQEKKGGMLITLTPKNPETDKADLGEALAIFKAMDSPATDWQIENTALDLGFKSTEDMLKKSAKIIQKRKIDTNIAFNSFKISELFGKAILTGEKIL